MINRTEIMRELTILEECCQQALNSEWDRSDEGFEAMLGNIDSIKSMVMVQSEEKE